MLRKTAPPAKVYKAVAAMGLPPPSAPEPSGVSAKEVGARLGWDEHVSAMDEDPSRGVITESRPAAMGPRLEPFEQLAGFGAKVSSGELGKPGYMGHMEIPRKPAFVERTTVPVLVAPDAAATALHSAIRSYGADAGFIKNRQHEVQLRLRGHFVW